MKRPFRKGKYECCFTGKLAMCLRKITIQSDTQSEPFLYFEKAAKYCDTDCYVVITATWNQTPAIKSYDVIGARLENASLSIDSVRTDSTNPNARWNDTRTSKRPKKRKPRRCHK